MLNVFGVLEVTYALRDVIYYTAFTLCTEGAPHGSVAAALVTPTFEQCAEQR